MSDGAEDRLAKAEESLARLEAMVDRLARKVGLPKPRGPAKPKPKPKGRRCGRPPVE